MRLQPKDMYCEHGRSAEYCMPKKAYQTQQGIGKAAFVGRGSPSSAASVNRKILQTMESAAGQAGEAQHPHLLSKTGEAAADPWAKVVIVQEVLFRMAVELEETEG